MNLDCSTTRPRRRDNGFLAYQYMTRRNIHLSCSQAEGGIETQPTTRFLRPLVLNFGKIRYVFKYGFNVIHNNRLSSSRRHHTGCPRIFAQLSKLNISMKFRCQKSLNLCLQSFEARLSAYAAWSEFGFIPSISGWEPQRESLNPGFNPLINCYH